MKKIIISSLLTIIAGLTFGIITNVILDNQASASENFKIDKTINGKPYVNNVEVDIKTGVPVETDKQKNKKITKDSSEAKERYITLRNGVNHKVVAKVTFEEFLNNQEYYNDLLDKETQEALEKLEDNKK